MGKQGRGREWQHGGGWESKPQSWDVWPGGRRSWEKRNSPKFPAYDADWTSDNAKQIEVIAERRFPKEQAGSKKSTMVQHAVNVARKAETRLSNLQKEQVTREEKWAAYQLAVKAAFNKEKAKYQKDIQRITTDIAAAVDAQNEAHVMMEYVALNSSASRPERESEREQEAAWDVLMQDAEEDDAAQLRKAQGELRAYMEQQSKQARELRELQEQRRRAAQEAHAVPTVVHPSMESHPAPPEVQYGKAPPASGETAAPTGHGGPYVPSPSSRTGTLPSPGRSPGTHPRGGAKSREPLKGAPLKPVHTDIPPQASLGDKLLAKRAAMAAKAEGGGPPLPSAEATIDVPDDEEVMDESAAALIFLVFGGDFDGDGSFCSPLLSTITRKEDILRFLLTFALLGVTGDEVEFSGHQVLTFVFEECPDAEETDQIAMWGPWYKYDALPEGTLELTPTVCPVLEATLPILCLEDLHPQKGPNAPWAPLTCKLLSEPESHSLAERDRIEDARDFEEGEGRVWPFLPAGDQYAMQRLAERAEIEEDTFQSEEASDFTFCLLTPGYVLEPVVVTLTAPIEVPEALDAVQTERDQVRRRLYPSLVVVGPQPAQGFGVLLALPVWTSPEVFICFSLLDIDDRLFTAPVPAVVSRERLLEIAALMPAEHFDVYVGGSPTPMLDEQEADMMRGMCVFFFPRHVLPGPYFNLTESLLSSTVWESEPSIPFGPSDGYMCFVGEFALRRLPLAEDTSFPDAALVADAMGLNPSTMLVQPAFPATRDVAIDGFYCYNVCAALDPADHIEPSENPTCVVLVDCRALLQGWQMVSSPAGIFSRRQLLEDLEIFAPPGWSVHLEGVPSDCDLCDVTPGQVLYASYVMDTHPWQGPLRTEADEHQHAHAAESDDSESDMFLQSEASDPGPAGRDRSRSPYRNPANAAGTPAAAPVKVPFLLLGQEYAPELVVVLRTDDLEECIRSVQSGRDCSNRSRFGHVVPVRPQPAAEYARAVVKPTWSTHVFVIFDCLKVNGVAFCWLASPAMTRSAILAVSGLPDTSDYEVYAPDRDMPLGQFEVCNLETGACISIIPAACQFFVVTSLEDMLLSNDGWSTEAALPCAPGEWLYVLSDSGPCSLQLAETRADLLTPAVATILELPLQSATLQLAVPPVDDFADEGRLAWNVVAATSDSSYRQGCIYFLDLRPILCGMTWAHSPDGTVSTELIRAQCARPAAGGHQVQVLGGRPLADAAGMVSVWPGEVLVVTVSDSSEPPVASDSSCETDSESHDPARPGSNGSSDPGDSAMPDDGRQPNASEARDTSALSGAPSERRFAHSYQLLGRGPVDCLSHPCAGRAARQRPLVHFATAIVAFAAIALLASAIRHEASLALCLLPLGYPRRLLSVLAALWIARLPAVASVQIKGSGPFPFEIETRPFSALPQIRAVATPCRGPEFPRFAFPDTRESSESSAAGIDFEDLSTLLDASVRAPECTAFFDATMLVETLFEHFCPHLLPEVASDKPVCPPSLAPQTGDLTRSHDISAGEPPCQLVLSALLLPDEAAASRSGVTQATDWYALDRGCCSIPVSDVHWRDLTRFTPLIRLMRDIQDLPDRHRFSRWCEAGGHMTLPADTSALCLTSDGYFSSSQGAAGWGLVISATTPDHPDVPGLFIGFTAAASIDTWRFGGDDAPALNAFCSEIVGLFWAAVAAFQIPFDGQVIFRCDNEAALGIASGSHVAPCQVVTAACQSLHQAFALRFPGRAVYVHVRGNSGDPANELADASANRGAVTPMPQVFQLDLPAWFRPGGSAFQWLPHLGWTLARPLQGPSCTSGSLRWDLTEPIASLDAEQLMRPFTRAFPAHKESRLSAHKLCLGFATFNTLSLACPGEDRGVQSGMYGHTGRVALLDASLFAEEIFVAGLQETRTPEGQLYSKHYHRYCSG
ncbi:unnamed protein product [Symbiodinium sp. KB8]|nr:unnamed protein product [Symbiodinium sp. KB8]